MTTSDITISWPGGRCENPISPVTIGRDPAATVPLASSVVSRSHASLTFEPGTGWVFRDLGSTFGSYVDGNRVSALPLARSTSIRLGTGPEAVAVEFRVPASISSSEATSQGDPAPVPRRPGGMLAPQDVPATVVRDAPPVPTLVVRTNDGEVTITAGGPPAVIGRDPGCTVVLTELSVSRRHLSLQHDGKDWLATDLGSAAGTWLAGRRVASRPLTEATVLTLGDRLTGPRVELRPDRPASAAAPGGRRMLGMPIGVATGVAVLLIAAIVAAVLLVVKPFRSTSVPLADLVRSTVQIWGEDGTADGYWSGSGTIIDARQGLILTNAHVAQPQAPGLAVQYGPLPVHNPKRLVISVSPGLDRPAEDRFLGRTVAYDGYLDMAIVKITSTLSGTPVTPADLADLKATAIGDSDTVHTGDAVRIIGYPGQARSSAATVSSGVISGSRPDDRLQAARAMFLSDAFSGAGNSGGLVADGSGRIIAVLSLGTVPREETENSLSGARPIDFAADLITAARSGAGYASPYAEALPDGASITAVGFSAPAESAGYDRGCAGTDKVQVPAFAVQFKGFGTREHTDLRVEVFQRQADSTWSRVLSLATADDYPFQLNDSGCVRVTFPVQLSKGTYLARACGGGDYAVCAQSEPFAWG